jgi:ACS family hexuronate transporter-like MFS transporter
MPTAATTKARFQLRHLRWLICGLLFFATTLSYVDRYVLGILKSVLMKDLGWNQTDYGVIQFWFKLAYAVMMPVAGRLLDWMGTRLGNFLAVLIWSLAAMGHALASTVTHFSVARVALGVGEAANFPAAIKVIAMWFPRRERATATGIFNSGSNLGSVFALLTVPWLAHRYGWQAAFLLTGALGFVWLVAWATLFRDPERHPWITAEERKLIEAEAGEDTRDSVPARELLGRRALWVLVVGKFLTDPVWWFYLDWLPGFLNEKYKLDLMALGLPLIVMYVGSSVGSVAGGELSSWLLRRGWPLNRARKTAMLVCALGALPVAFASRSLGNLWLLVALVTVAAAAHQGWSANLFTLASDLFPRSAVASVTGVMGMGGAIGGMLAALVTGLWLDWSGNAYGPLFLMASVAYVATFVVMHLMAPQLIPEKS